MLSKCVYHDHLTLLSYWRLSRSEGLYFGVQLSLRCVVEWLSVCNFGISSWTLAVAIGGEVEDCFGVDTTVSSFCLQSLKLLDWNVSMIF